MRYPSRIISGGQTGADLGALVGAESCGIETGGTAPHGYRTENGDRPDILRDRFHLVEHWSTSYAPRTRCNVRDADGTVIFGNLNSTGCKLTLNIAHELRKPHLENPCWQELKRWCYVNHIAVLNVAGNRESTNRGIALKVAQIIARAFGE